MTAVFPEAAAGADDALELLYRDYAQDVSRYALAVLGDRADAEDVTQTTFLNAFRALQRGERPRQPDHWLIAIAHNACRERFRAGQRRPREVVFVEEAGAAPVRDDDGPTAVELRAALLELHPSQRAALVMRELEGRPNAEIALALGLSVSAVETLLFRARRALREQLGEQLLCSDALVAIARQAEGALARTERAGLRAHLRKCPDCAQAARSRRARRTVLGGFVPVPSWLSSLFGSGGAGGVGLLAKAAAVVVTGAVLGGGVSAGATHVGWTRPHRHARTVGVPTVLHARASLPVAHAPLPVAGARAARPTPFVAPVGPPSRPESVPGQQAAAPQVPTQAAPVAAGVSEVSSAAGVTPPPAVDGNGVKAGQGAAGSGGPKANGSAGAAGNSAAAKAAAPGQVKKNQQQPAAPAAATPGNSGASPAPPASPPAQPAAPNGQGNGQANGQGNGQANGQAAPPSGGPPASVPAQSNAGGNGHH